MANGPCADRISLGRDGRGIDKAYGMRKLAEYTGISLDDMLFIGDQLDPDGNDFPGKAMGVARHEVVGWEDTADYLEELLAKRSP